MDMKKIIIVLLLQAIGCFLYAKNYSLFSPDKRIRIEIQVDEHIGYHVYVDNHLIMDSCSLSMTLRDGKMGVNPKIKKIYRNTINETIQREIPFKNALVKNHCHVLRMDFVGNYSVEFRAFDNGMAYRFITNVKEEIEVLSEECQLNFPKNYLAHLSQPNSFKTSYEYPYSHVWLENYSSNDRMTYLPILVETDKKYKILISEADLHDYPCMFFKSNNQGGLTSLFPPCPLEFGEDGDRSVKIVKEADYIAKTNGSRQFPWRYFVISKEDRDLVSNEMSYVLSSPCVLKDFQWIKPGQVSWEWWHDARLYGVDFRSGYNMDSYKYYIDFASSFGIPYIIMDEGWAKSTTDPFTPNPTINLQELIAYAKAKNVKIVLWLTWLTVENNFDLFKRFAEWGIAGVKIDFMDRSDQWMVNFYERVAAEAARYHLFVDFHGAFKPAGLERRFPNVLSYEGVLGMEQGGNCKPSNSIYLPFMRGAVGPMDFTPGSMLSAQPEDNRYTRANAMGSGTRAYQMALFVVFESGLQMLADNPVYYYRERECTQFITSVPVVWDETRVLDAVVGEYVVVARRSGSKWFIGAITNDKGRELVIDLSFLPDASQWKLTGFQDGINADRQAMDYKKITQLVNNQSSMKLNLVRNGGWAGVVEPIEP